LSCHHQRESSIAIEESELAKLDGLALLPGMPAEVFTDSVARTFRDE
jgi:hypothetical protein